MHHSLSIAKQSHSRDCALLSSSRSSRRMTLLLAVRGRLSRHNTCSMRRNCHHAVPATSHIAMLAVRASVACQCTSVNIASAHACTACIHPACMPCTPLATMLVPSMQEMRAAPGLAICSTKYTEEVPHPLDLEQRVEPRPDRCLTCLPRSLQAHISPARCQFTFKHKFFPGL